MSSVTVKVKKLRDGATIPRYQSKGAAGVDLHASYRSVDEFERHYILHPGEHRVYWTGIAIELPTGWEAQIRPRSGLAAKHGISVVNSPGTVDADYRGEIGITLINHGAHSIDILEGDRIAQMVVKEVPVVTFEEVAELNQTERGDGGMGSTGGSQALVGAKVR